MICWSVILDAPDKSPIFTWGRFVTCHFFRVFGRLKTCPTTFVGRVILVRLLSHGHNVRATHKSRLVLMSARKQLTPFVFVTASCILGTVALAAGALVMKSFEGDTGQIGAVTLEEYKAKDGSTIRLHAVSFGTRHSLDVSVVRPNAFIVFESGYRNMRVDRHSSDDQIVVWLSRTDANGRASDFSWWSHCSVTDLHGDEIRDSEAERHVLYGWSHNQDGQSHGVQQRFLPYQEQHRYYASENKMIIVNSFLPKIRSQGDITIKVFNIQKEKVAEFTVPNPTPQPTKTWVAQELPAESTVDGLTLRLKSFATSTHKNQHGRDQNLVRHTVSPKFEMIDSDGKVSNDYQHQYTQYFDPLENVGNEHDVRLSFKEPVWRLETKVFRKSTSEFTAEETIEFAPIEIPQKNTTVALGLDFGNSKIQLAPAQISGPGATSYIFPSGPYGGSSSFLRTIDKATLNVHLKTQNRITTATVNGDLVHLRFDHRPLTPDERLSMFAVDDQNRKIKLRHEPHFGSNFCFLKVEPDAKSITFSAVLQELKKFEFYIKPPKPKPLEK
jgi:hypothetical protein